MQPTIMIGAILSLLTLTGTASRGANSETAMFRGDLQHTGVYHTRGGGDLTGVKWRFKTGGRVISSPAIADGTLYIGSGDNSLYAIAAASGKLRWRFATKDAVDSSPAVSDGAVFFVSRDGSCYAVDTSTGKLKWQFHTDGEKRFSTIALYSVKEKTECLEDPWDFYLSSPAVANGLVYFGSGSGYVYAVSTATGKQVWRFHTNGVVHSSPAVAKGVVYVGSWDSCLYALDARTGAERWRYLTAVGEPTTTWIGIQSSPAVVDGVIYCGSRDAKLHAVDAATGKEKWATPMEGRNWVISAPAVAAGRVYFGTSISARFMALDARTGEEKLNLPLGMILFSSPAIVGDTAYIGSMNGRLYAVDLLKGQIKWYYQTDASTANAHGLRMEDGSMNPDLFNAPDVWSYRNFVPAVESILSLGSVLSSPVVADSIVYFGSTDGYVYALGQK